MVTALSLAVLMQAQEAKPVMLPDITLTDMKGDPVRLRKYSGKKLILFNWASW